ncbi:hypothetical protein B0H17DRAFT_1198716 [Mycena rosella]|uniref:NAD(P)-binding domain-containing protein n=1 Tax=Mycena rosella TaxID=1033263 RepID=A0AAD7DMT8_MYCRO|nr:hypothetical protein B0H17DRAFT_1198716 [Mycena rosella]
MSPSILLLGATGASGLAFIQVALSQPTPPKLTLYIRPGSRAKLPAGIETQTRVVEGQLTDGDALREAMDGVDTVVSVLGAYPSLSGFLSRSTSTPIADAFEGIIAAMRATGATRIFALSTQSFSPDPAETLSLKVWGYGLMPKILVPQGNAEMVGIGEAVAAASDLDWTVFRVPHLTDGAADLPVFAGLLGPEYKGSLALSRASLAAWILKEMEERKWVKNAPVLGNY